MEDQVTAHNSDASNKASPQCQAQTIERELGYAVLKDILYLKDHGT